jgi:hypothetical protein
LGRRREGQRRPWRTRAREFKAVSSSPFFLFFFVEKSEIDRETKEKEKKLFDKKGDRSQRALQSVREKTSPPSVLKKKERKERETSPNQLVDVSSLSLLEKRKKNEKNKQQRKKPRNSFLSQFFFLSFVLPVVSN